MLQIAVRSKETSSSSITYNILNEILGSDLKRISEETNTQTIRSKTLKKYVDTFKELHNLLLFNHNDLTQELYLLHETAKGLMEFNDHHTKLSYKVFRAKLFFPNLIYILIRLCPNANKFLRSSIKKVYAIYCKKHKAIINAHINSYYLDQDIIKTDILYQFLGNGLRKLNPLEVHNLHGFYYACFERSFSYYFKNKQEIQANLLSIFNIHDVFDVNFKTSTRLSVYRDVLYEMQVEKFYQRSPTISQICFNFSIFRNIITNNEFQSTYFSTYKDVAVLNNEEYKLIKFYDDDSLNKDLIVELKKLPIIYQLLKAVRISNQNAKPYNEMMIKPKMVQDAVLEELMYPFRGFFHESYLYDILEKIAFNFTKSILSGEYINLLTLSHIKIDHISFIIQLKKFISLCLNTQRESQHVGRIARY